MALRALGVALAATVLLAAAGCGDDSVSVRLTEQGDSGQSGQATITAEGYRTTVVIELSNQSGVPQPSHIHQGTCDDPNPRPAFALNNVAGGKATTTINASLALLQVTDYYVNVHKSESEIGIVVACGDIPMVRSGGGGY